MHGTPLALVHGTPQVLVPLAQGDDRLVLHGLYCGELVRGGLDCGGQVHGGLDCGGQVHGGLDCGEQVHGGLDCGGQAQNEPSCYAMQRDGPGGGVLSRGDLCHHGTQVHGVPNPLNGVPHHDAPLQVQGDPTHDDQHPPHGVQLHGVPVHGAQVHGVHGLFQDGRQGVHLHALHDAQAHDGSLDLDALHGASHEHAQKA